MLDQYTEHHKVLGNNHPYTNITRKNLDIIREELHTNSSPVSTASAKS